MKSIALLICYYGKLPFWMPAFLRTCEMNPTIDWLIFTDCEAPDSPENVKFIQSSLAEFKSRATTKIGVQPRISENNLHKICDFKGAFGHIFEDYIATYDFWGHCDIDVLWGDIRKFVTERLLDTHDLVTGRKEKVGGHFTIYRNTSEMRQLYRKIPDIASMLASQEHHAVDETRMTETLKTLRTFSLRRLAQNFRLGGSDRTPRVYWKQRLTVNGGRQVMARRADGKFLRWAEGRTFDTEGNEVMYLHFHRLKDAMNPEEFKMTNATNEFRIDDRGIRSAPDSRPLTPDS